MDLLIATNSVPLSGADTVPSSGTPQYATDGNPAAAIPATDAPAYHYNMMMAELWVLVRAAELTPSGADWTQVLQAVSLIGKRYQVITSNENWTVPNGVYQVRVRLIGGGGGGSGSPSTGSQWSGSGGGAGGYCEGVTATTPGAALPVVVGAGGTGGAPNSSGGTGGTTSFAGMTATGGLGGNANAGGGGGGTASGGAINLVGGVGCDGVDSASSVANALFIGTGDGADGPWGGAGKAGSASGSGLAKGYGAGGGGAYVQNNISGGPGSAGVVILEY